MPPLICYQNVTVTRKGADILKGFNLEIQRGEKVLVYGKSGIGKSTVLKLLLGFTRPDRGAVFFDDHPLDRKQVWEVRKRIAYVSQDLDIGQGRVSDFISHVMGYKVNASIGTSDEKLDNAMSLLELEPSILDKSLEEISGGEKQRVALACALLLERDVYLLDEATSAVDLELKKKVVRHFTSLEDVTLLCVSHDVNWLEAEPLEVVRLEVPDGSA